MPRTYSFDHFQAKKPMQAAVGSSERLGNDEDQQKPLKSELQETQPETVPGSHQGGVHYGMAHAETVQRLQARRAARAKKEARAAAATKRPTGARKAARADATEKPAPPGKTAKATSGDTPPTARAASGDTAPTARAKPASKTVKAAKATKPATAEHTKAATARKKVATRASPAAEPVSAPTKRATAAPKKQGLLGRVVGSVAKTAFTTGTKGLARAAALAKEVRASRSKSAAKKASAKADKSKKR